MESHMPISCLTGWHPPFEIRFKLGSKKSQLDIWARQKPQPYFLLNPGCLTGVLISWFMKKSLHNWVLPGPLFHCSSQYHRTSPRVTNKCNDANLQFGWNPAFPIPSWFSGIMRNYPWLYLRDKFNKPSAKGSRGILNNQNFNDFTEKVDVSPMSGLTFQK